AQTVVDALVRKVKSLEVEIRLESSVIEVLYSEGQVSGVRLGGGESFQGRTVIVATGGKSVPQTGSTGDGYKWAIAAGHTITELYPTEVPLTSRERVIVDRKLQGLALKNVALTVWNSKGKAVVTHEGDMLFTHFGLSGPAALRCSQFVVKGLRQTGVTSVRLTIDLFPDKSKDELYRETLQLAEAESKKAIKNVLKVLLPERLIPILLQKVEIPEDITYDNLPKQQWLGLAALLKAFPVEIDGTLSIEVAFVTGGGVQLKEIDPRTMGSKITNGLYFCGEILDVHGYTGGYNITAAFSSGYTAGFSAAEEALQNSPTT
ncbi:MAG: NAD(P)/FAD-dependent oxidoreductase, partial [Gorillibacterium sp.]|nr:NAD(P)/FAD-dependent oxidoreductase [Gorillibacterium sp.]